MYSLFCQEVSFGRELNERGCMKISAFTSRQPSTKSHSAAVGTGAWKGRCK